MDIRKLRDEAQTLVARGKVKKALEVYRSLVAAQPENVSLRLRYAETARKASEMREAVSAWLAAAELLAREGHSARAQAALRLALEVAPESVRVHRALQRLAAPREVPIRAVTLELEVIDVPVEALETTAQPEIRRLSDNAVACRYPGDSRWTVFTSSAPIEVAVLEGEPQALPPEELPPSFPQWAKPPLERQ